MLWRSLALFIIGYLLAFVESAYAVPLDTIGTFCGTFPSQCQKGSQSLWAARGTGTNAYYVLEVDPTTGALPVNVVAGSFTVSVASDGPTGSAVPAQASYAGFNNGGTLIGGVADSSGRQIVAGAGTAGTPAAGVLSVQGVSGGQVLPVSGTVAATQSGTWTVQPGNTANSTPWLTTISQGGNSATVSAGGALKVDASASIQPVSGTVTANQGTANATPWTVTGTGSAGSAASGVVTIQGIASMTAVKVDGSGVTQPTNITQFGGSNVVTGTGTGGSGIPRVTVSSDSSLSATNFPATVDTNSGAAGASTIRIVPSTRSEAAATPLSVRQSNGTSFADYGSGAVASTTLRVVTATDTPAGAGRAYADSVRYAYSSGAVGTSSWVQLIAATAATINCLQLFDSSGQVLELGAGAAAAESRILIVPPGGLDGCVPLRIAAGTRISIRALSATTGTVGEIDITGLQ